MGTPDEWNLLIGYLMEALVKSWRVRRFGFILPDWASWITHVVWADKIWLIAASSEQLHTMTVELTEAVYGAKLKWKTSSLEVLRGGLALDSSPGLSITTPDFDILMYEVVDQMEVLGSLLDGRGSTWGSVHHRLHKAEAGLWSSARAFMGPGPVKSKLKAWAAGAATSALLDSTGWSINKGILQFLCRWE